MVFNQDIVFIHIGKTGGMSCAHYLLQNLCPPVYNCHVEADIEAARYGYRESQVVPVLNVNRHCTLAAAEQHILRLTGVSTADRRVLAVVRNPYDLEYSFYRHLQKDDVIERRKKNDSELVALAQGDFGAFVKHAGYHRPGLRQEDYFMMGGVVPPNVEIIRFENLESAFRQAVQSCLRDGACGEFRRLNTTAYSDSVDKHLDRETKATIYLKHKYIFDHYYPDETP
ncbi:hypothetical protein [Parahaliea mediterranea]|uniref:hypothetical protein n=1 Tax=Parahaliea mediterranea TaxID=651086 RepID=UPI000E2FE1F0|nr:hypothetical protein [Parahaliea mediterranea]